ncbi:hypothetical protein [Streptomyces zagrosensis]|uniref:Uncharacterized protein n=1 Tax=Streptomyces zagrosensis TaxID=1042984 RepID=A0A7W9V1B0_9ACTN|nr:hypothetical protein [Streptomyces zagrosensis]MBB5939000.1 hypothetical protein [Streptomyces zagrosensis]
MKILSSAQACGFGPVSKLVAVTTMVGGGTVDFVGQGVALDFVRRHADRFGRVTAGDTAHGTEISHRLVDADLVLSVMDADLVFWAVRQQRRVVFFDSLLHFWATRLTFAELARCARLVRQADTATAWSAYQRLAPHERILVAHLLATRSLVQNFPGVRERIAELAAVGADHVRLCGPIVDTTTLRALRTVPPRGDGAGLLINLGGFKNFYLDYESRNAYLDLVQRWVVDLARDMPELGHILACCGAFARPETIRVGDVRVEFRFLPHREFLDQLAATALYAVPPSLTSLHEAVIVRRMPFLLPEQHYGHIVNRRMVADTAVGRHAASLRRCGPEFEVPEDDLEGTRELDRLTRELVDDEPRYQRLRAHLGDRFGAYRALTASQRDDAMDELADLLDGPPLTSLLADLDMTLLEAAER